jgi:hypothetical protein
VDQRRCCYHTILYGDWLHHAVRAGRIPCCRVSVIDCAGIGWDDRLGFKKVYGLVEMMKYG